MLRIILFAVCITLAFLTVAITGCLLFRRSKERKKSGLPTLQVLIAADFAAVLLMFVPIYYLDYFADTKFAILRPLLIAIHNSIRVFILDGEFDIIKESAKSLPQWLAFWFTSISAVLYIFSPVLTFSAVLSLFKNVFVKLKLKTGGKRNTYVFSELNGRSLVLAKSIIDKLNASEKSGPRIIFAGTSEQFCNDHSELKAGADELNAICVEDGIAELELSGCKAGLEFFVIGEDESKNLSDTIKLTEMYKLRKNTKVFIFSASEAVGVMLDSIEKTNLIDTISPDKFSKDKSLNPSEYFILRRVDENHVFADNTMRQIDIFTKYRAEMDALPWAEDGSPNPDKDKIISVLLLGLGHHGKALLKNLIWFCQMKGFFLEVNVVEKTSGPFGSVAGFIHECPGVMAVNNNYDYKGDARYSIKFLEGVDVTKGGLDWTSAYRTANAGNYDEDQLDTIMRLRRTSIVFATLGDDERNIGAAIDIRRLMDKITLNRLRDELQETGKSLDEVEAEVAKRFETEKSLPEIYAVVYDEGKSNALETINGLKHYNGNYDISFIGGLNEIYAYDNVFNEATEQLGFVFHAMWAEIGQEKKAYAQYETYEYLRNSSLAQAIHKKNSLQHGFIREDVPEEEKAAYAKLEERIEHIRWCAYVRSVGYEYCGYNKKIARNDRAKWHHDLVPHAELSEEEKSKDVKILSAK